ncbi:hypothetical protein F4X88_10615 [Candidatus Poribacteria bacterium]|nr:hypothetical protein [Candidatus Poribacteria bacterium]MYA56738.1 hypothetical protein [Candidatus Poribacteria bacterium]
MDTQSSQAKNTSLFSFAQNIGLTNAIIFIVVVVGYLFTAPPVSVSGFSERLRLIVADIGAVIPAAFFVTFAIDVGGSLLMLFWNLMKRELNKHDAKLIEQGKAEGIEQGKAEAYQQVAEWNTRRLEAAAKGVPFEEPPPTQNGDQPNP